MSLIWALAAAAIAVAPADARAADPLAPARDGAVLCYNPNTIAKTCGQFLSYTFDAHGGIVEKQEMVLVPKPLAVLRAAGPVTLRDGAICGMLNKQDIDNAELTIDGKPASDDLTAKIRAQVAASDAAELGKEECTSLLPDGDHFAAHIAVGGSERPDMTTPVIWVKPADGYVLGGS